MSSSSLPLRCLGSAALSLCEALATGSNAATSFLCKAGSAALLTPLLFLGGGSSSLEELSSLLLSESLLLLESLPELLSESESDESLSEEDESDSPAQHGTHH